MKKTSLENIHNYLSSDSGNVTLSKQDEERMNRARAAWDLRIKLFTKGEIVDRLMSNYSINRSTAFNDINFSELLFSNPTKNQKKAQRAIMSNVCLRRARLAEELGDDKAMQKWMDLYGKYNMLDKDDPIVPDKDLLNINDIVTGIDPKLELYLTTLIDKLGATDATKLYDQAKKIEAEDIDFEELPIQKQS